MFCGVTFVFPHLSPGRILGRRRIRAHHLPISSHADGCHLLFRSAAMTNSEHKEPGGRGHCVPGTHRALDASLFECVKGVSGQCFKPPCSGGERKHDLHSVRGSPCTDRLATSASRTRLGRLWRGVPLSWSLFGDAKKQFPPLPLSLRNPAVQRNNIKEYHPPTTHTRPTALLASRRVDDVCPSQACPYRGDTEQRFLSATLPRNGWAFDDRCARASLVGRSLLTCIASWEDHC